MAVSFNTIPTALRTPLVYIEVDGSKAGTRVNNLYPLIIGQMLSTGTQSALTPIAVTSAEQARSYFGTGSNVAEMVETFRKNDDFTALYVMGVDDNGAGTAATGTIVITGTATAAGTLNIYVAGKRVQAAVASGDSATVVGDSVDAAINAVTSLGVTAVNVTGTVTLTHRHKGEVGNDYPVKLNWLGVNGGEETPAGISVAITQLSGGATNPDISTALTALGSEEYEYHLFPWTDTANLDAYRDWMDDTTGRWAWDDMLYGMGFTGKAGTYAELITFGGTRNDQHTTVVGVYDSPNPAYQWAAAWSAQAAKSLTIDPARPLQTLVLKGVLSPASTSRFTHGERNALLYKGVATFTVRADGQPAIERSITTYRLNGTGDPDNAYLDIQTLATIAYFNREVRFRVNAKYARHKLANDGTKFGAGQPIVTPNTIRGEMVAMYEDLMTLGLVENMEEFKARMIVERNGTDPNRLDVVLTPDWVNQLRVFAAKTEFRLQF